MSRARRVSLKTVELSAEAQEAWEIWQRSQPTLKKARAARKVLDREFGRSPLGQLPDGRLLLRTSASLPPTELNDYSELDES